MTGELWSWVLGGLSVLGATGLWLAGSSGTRAAGWVFGLVLQWVWCAYALLTAQYGFLVSCVLFTIVNARNLRLELRARRAAPVAPVRASVPASSP